MAKRCPKCRTEVPADAHVCPNCPWIFPDDDETGRPSASVPTHWSPLPFVACALLGGGICALWYFFVTQADQNRNAGASDGSRAGHGQFAPSRGTAAKEPPSLEGGRSPLPEGAAAKEPPSLEGGSSPLPEGATGQGLPSPVVDVPEKRPFSSPRRGRRPDRQYRSRGRSGPREEGAPVYISAEAARVKEWKLRGYVYDLLTLKPVPRCRLVLSDLKTSARFETATDAGGRYRAILSPLPGRGYMVNIPQPGYASSYLDPGAEGVRDKPESERQELCRDLAATVLQPASLQPHGSDPLVTDFYIAPRACR